MWPFGRKKSPNGFSWHSTAEEVTEGIDASGLTAIVTGASSGIGAETCRVLALRGVHVVMSVRNVSAGAAVKEGILEKTPNPMVDILQVDLSSKSSVRKFASEFISSGLPLNMRNLRTRVRPWRTCSALAMSLACCKNPHLMQRRRETDTSIHA